MSLTLVTREITFGDSTHGQAYFATDGTSFWPVSVLVDSAGSLINTASGIPVTATGTFWQTTQPISAASLPLPAGAATAAGQASILAAVSSPLAVTGTFWQATQPISAASLPLPAGAATSANQASLITAVQAPLAAQSGNVVIGGTQMTALAGAAADGWNVTQGTQADSAWAGSGSGTEIAVLKAISLGQPTAATQGSTTSGETGPIVQGAVTTAAPSYTTAKTNPLSLNTAGGLRVDGSGVTQPISASSLPLPSGAATAAKQPALGTAGAAASDVLSVQGIASMTALKVDGSAVTQPISAASLPLPAGAATAANQPTVAAQGSTTAGQTGRLIEGAVTTSAPTYTTAQTSPLSLNIAGALRIDGSGVTQPVSAAALPLPSGAATSANQPTNAAQGSTTAGQTGHLMEGAVTTGAPSYTTAQTSPLSLTPAGALRTDASATTQPVSAASLPLPSGASTSANQATAAAQGSTTSGQTGPLMQGAVTTGAPSYTNTQTSPLSLDTAGNLRVNLVTGGGSGNVAQGSTTSGETGPLIQGAVATAAPSYTTAQTSPLSLTTAGALRVYDATLHADATSPIPAQAGSVIIGGVGIDPANNGVSVSGVATSANQPTNAAQASTTSGQTGTLCMGASITSNVTYVNGNTGPLTVDAYGQLLTARGTFSTFANSAMTVTASAYTAGYVVGGIQQFSKTGKDGSVQSITLTSLNTNAAVTFDAYVFHTYPSTSVSGNHFNDHAAPTILPADVPKVLACVPMGTGKSELGTHTVWNAQLNPGLPIQGLNVYIVFVVTTSYTPLTTTELSARVVGTY